MTTDHKGLPVSGYTDQPQSNVDLANEGKALEERYLRWLDKLIEPNGGPYVSERNHFIALARDNIRQGAMWAVRSIFLPQRIKLPEDGAQ